MRRFMGTGGLCLALAFGLLIADRASAQVSTQRALAPVVEAILGAWESADLVCLGEDHGRRHDSDLRLALIRHPRFASIVDAVVVEMANNAHQPLLDRFVLDGEEMTRDQIAVVWRDASSPEVWESPIYEELLRAIREVNLQLPRDQRVRVIGGDTAVDWSRIRRAEDLVPLLEAGLQNRGRNIRRIIAEQVLDRNLKALAIYGSRHCQQSGMGFPGALRGSYPGRIWSISTVAGEAAANARGLFGVTDQPAYVVTRGTRWDSQPAAGILLALRDETFAQMGDAIAYLGLVPEVIVRADPSELTTKYGAELGRRRQLMEAAEGPRRH